MSTAKPPAPAPLETVSKKDQVRLAREEKIAKEARAVLQSAAAANWNKLEKSRGQNRLKMEKK
ncbi:hypothetical protein P3T76_013557 [Phytophthora citrophthora]|uniref:Uncharacterized protein n=1 Tax=Phytophthora citrophthora TaxID=4793 RepID=A0AAD9LBX5_9STRA|nr:hypothetical protein P3T76_013557 [Phytophthora citrophthora]